MHALEEEQEAAEEMSSKSSISSAATNSRWSPTKEQITVLESLYKQGIRTPSADQIQQIAGILREYGTIEGKNVFYWFQNHKARQRQKQKQETMACFNRLLRKAASVSPPPLLPHHHHLPVGCSPYYFPHATSASVGYYPHYPNVFLPGVIPKRPDDYSRLQQIPRSNERVNCITPKPQYPCGTSTDVCVSSSKEEMNNTHQTLQLFPLHPSGLLEERSGYNSVDSNRKEDVREEDDDDSVVEN